MGLVHSHGLPPNEKNKINWQKNDLETKINEMLNEKIKVDERKV
ncbi:hypothetical protein B4064_2959 [Caldibacillus thermoamylovorans]|nr:hypothetical protein B4065_3202 [Caldibacillus thermoamylovorans]KIO63741.1 hypothetical protein B4064_2959 [Caldibacillus thermoamylovorans]